METIELTLDEQLQKLVEKQNIAMGNLHDIQFKNPPTLANLPDANSSNTYNVDLATRTIKAPEFLSVAKDHKSTVIYFKVDRYFEYMDLANTICVIEYIVPNSEKKVPYIYVVPFLDTITYAVDGKMVFPWIIGGVATQQDGILEYDIRFYRLESLTKDSSKIAYDLHTLPAKSKILTGLDVNDNELEYEYEFDAGYKEILAQQIIDNATFWRVL